MVDFEAHEDGVLTADGHDHDEVDLRAGLSAYLSGDRAPSVAVLLADQASFAETWYCDAAGFGHDCSLHADLDKAEWSEHCDTFRPVTLAADIPASGKVQRAGKGS